LSVVRIPYVVIALVVLAVMVVFLISKMPDAHGDHEAKNLGELVRHISTPRYLFGVVAQAFYVGAQIMCWTYIIHYGMTLLGLTAADAQQYNIIAMVIFLTSRFICTFLLQYFRPGLLLGMLAIGGLSLTLGAIYLEGFTGLYCLIGISACMSLMFPTIYGLALDGMNPEDAKLASAGLIFAIVGGALMPPLQGQIIDTGSFSLGLGWINESLSNMITIPLGFVHAENIRASFILPVVCFVVVALYGFMTSRSTKAG
jgi:FHS family L-fucose permease-like MFS transporter